MYRTVAAFREPWEAHMLCGRLAAEGVPAVVAHEMHVANKWVISIALGGVKVQVPDDRFAEARAVERNCLKGEYRALLASELGDLDDVVCPKCGSDRLWQRRPLPRAILSLAVSLTIGFVLAPIGWIYCCRKCGAEFRPPRRAGFLRKWITVVILAAALGVLTVLLGAWFHSIIECHPEYRCSFL